MSLIETIARAICCRQAERMDRGEPAMTEMWVAAETFDQMRDEAKAICIYPGEPRAHPECMGVKIMRMNPCQAH